MLNGWEQGMRSRGQTKTRFVFFGTGNFAVGVLRELKRNNLLPELLITAPDNPAGRHLVLTPPPAKVWAIENKIPILQPAKLPPSDFEFRTSNFDLFIVSDYGKIIPDSILKIPRLGVLLTHQSLLPKYRGASPIQYAILNDEKETGVSVIVPDDQIDHGKIVSQKKIVMTGDETSGQLEAELSKIGGQMLREIFSRPEEAIAAAAAQDHSQATFTKKIEKSECFIPAEACFGALGDEESSKQWERRVRAYFPAPIAYTILKLKNGKEIRVQILKAEVEKGKFLPLLVRPAGKKEMSWEDFQRGNQRSGTA